MYKKMFVILHSLELITPDVFLAEIWMKLYRFDNFLVNRIFVMSCQNILTPSDRFLDIFPNFCHTVNREFSLKKLFSIHILFWEIRNENSRPYFCLYKFNDVKKLLLSLSIRKKNKQSTPRIKKK